MAHFAYTAINSNGKTVKGKIAAANEADLEMRMKQQGLEVLHTKMLTAKKKRRLGKINTKDMIMFCIHMEQLDKAGVPILDSLADMRDSSDNATVRDIMAEIHENVKGGELLSQAMSHRTEVFGEVFIGLVATGEKTGNLADSFKNLAEHMKWTNDLRRAVKKAVSYPIVLLFVMSGVITMMMLFVVPKMVDFLTTQGFDLPFYTTALIATSNAFVNYWYLMIGIPIFSIIATIVSYRVSPQARRFLDKVFLKVPSVGQVILKINLARFSQFFSVTFRSGLGVLECLQTCRKVMGNVILQEAVDNVMRSVSEGSNLTQSLAATGKFPSLVIRMFKVGEESGNMESALENINFFYEREVKDSVDSMIGIIQPALTVVMGGLMLWITAAVFGPLYDSFSKMGF